MCLSAKRYLSRVPFVFQYFYTVVTREGYGTSLCLYLGFLSTLNGQINTRQKGMFSHHHLSLSKPAAAGTEENGA